MCNPDFKIALESGCDFSDIAMTEIWHISDYVRLKRFNLPTEGIEIEHNGVRDSILPEDELIDFMEKNDIHPLWMEEVSG